MPAQVTEVFCPDRQRADNHAVRRVRRGHARRRDRRRFHGWRKPRVTRGMRRGSGFLCGGFCRGNRRSWCGCGRGCGYGGRGNARRWFRGNGGGCGCRSCRCRGRRCRGCGYGGRGNARRWFRGNGRGWRLGRRRGCRLGRCRCGNLRRRGLVHVVTEGDEFVFEFRALFEHGAHLSSQFLEFAVLRGDPGMNLFGEDAHAVQFPVQIVL